MTIHRNGQVISMRAGEVSIPAGRIVRMGSNNSVLIPDTNLTQHLVGITRSSASLTGESVAVVINGTAKAQAGTNLTSGDLCTFQTGTGLLLSTTTLDKSKESVLRPIIGTAMHTGSKSTMVEVLINIQQLNKTAYS